MRNILFDLLKTNENISLANNVSSICLSDVILPALIAKKLMRFLSAFWILYCRSIATSDIRYQRSFF